MTDAAKVIKKKTNGFAPKVGIVLGSGLGGFADAVEDAHVIGYEELDGFPPSGVHGHASRLVLGRVGQTDVAVCQGRAHYYEHGNPAAMKEVVRTLKAIGCETLILTNAAGSLLEEAQPGAVIMLNDHINLTGVSPLFNETGNSRFVDMVDAYDPSIRTKLETIAKDNGITLHQGVYAWFCGPHFETAAEIRMAKTLGADAVGMSTVPEVILAREASMKVAAMSIVTNMAAGMSTTALSHEQTMDNAAEGAAKVQTLITALLEGSLS
ncbi:purine-nucleoside phosphorylase [Aestuariispira insulae]|uniref:Purine nucleoside phosphorylase n=1 Tax=Aestuariispira insulae TaxID=1461337 RepID=A0A3D9HN82_9PROT|nr:purine-nucleoside phosphorylase [Aestuariispira insulae]RED50865.1 purine-nucleoside phosphorylase [Aestuariispira insulae]